MKLTLNAIVFAMASVSIIPTVFAANATSDGQVHISGTVIQNACVVDGDEGTTFDVELMDVNKVNFVNVGDTAANQSFNIRLKDCDVSTYTNVKVRFEGTTDDDAGTTVLKNTGGDATGFGLQILDAGSPMTFNDQSAWSTNTKIADGTNSIPFTAQYISTKAQADLVAGTVDATATFYLQYN